MIYNMDYCGVTSASRLYSAISPLFRSAPALRETALLVLRKLMYSCSEEARQVAVVGFLQILKHFRYFSSTLQGIASSQSIASSSSSMSSSQSAIDLHQHSSANTNRLAAFVKTHSHFRIVSKISFCVSHAGYYALSLSSACNQAWISSPWSVRLYTSPYLRSCLAILNWFPNVWKCFAITWNFT